MKPLFKQVSGPFTGQLGGITWNEHEVLFSLLDEMIIKQFNPITKKTNDFRKYTGRINGICYEKCSNIIYAAQEGGRRVIQLLPDGSATVTALRYRGEIHNHPSDLTLDDQGRIWFCDPYSPILAFGPQFFPTLDHASVMRIEKNERHAYVIERMTFDTKAPRAVILSLDQKTLYVAEGDLTSHVRELRAYPINDSKKLGRPKVFYTFGKDDFGPHRGIEGLCTDQFGNILACGGSFEAGPGPMLFIFSPDGHLMTSHPLPFDLPAKIAFGGEALNNLYITSGDGFLYEWENCEFKGKLTESLSIHQ
jgi:sugar lactone lactonase YvrE